MKKMFRFVVFIIYLIMVSMVRQVAAQPSPNQNGNGNPVGGDPIGGGASIGGGIAILMILGLGYGAKKLYDVRKRPLDE